MVDRLGVAVGGNKLSTQDELRFANWQSHLEVGIFLQECACVEDVRMNYKQRKLVEAKSLNVSEHQGFVIVRRRKAPIATICLHVFITTQ